MQNYNLFHTILFNINSQVVRGQACVIAVIAVPCNNCNNAGLTPALFLLRYQVRDLVQYCDKRRRGRGFEFV